MNTLNDLRDSLKLEIEHKAEWRELKSTEYPENYGNHKARRLLKSLGRDMEAVPELVLLRVHKILEHKVLGEQWGDIFALQLGNAGFSYFPESAAELLTDVSRSVTGTRID